MLVVRQTRNFYFKWFCIIWMDKAQRTYLVEVDDEHDDHRIEQVEQVGSIRAEEHILEVAELKKRVKEENEAAFELLVASCRVSNRKERETLPNNLSEDICHREERDSVAHAVALLQQVVQHDDHH